MSELLVGERESLADGTRLLVSADGIEIGVFEHAGQLYAFENRCLHQGGPVCEGTLLGAVERVFDADGLDRGGRFNDEEAHIVCPWHGWEFRLDTGSSVAYPDLKLRQFPIIERGGRIYVEL